MVIHHLDQTKSVLHGPTQAEIEVHNQYAATALNRFHSDSSTMLQLVLDGVSKNIQFSWNSEFNSTTMRESVDLANHGGVALAWFIMSVLLGYEYVEQSEIGDGVDYRFIKSEPDDDELNFLDDYHYVEISGILIESETNTLQRRIKEKHRQIGRGSKSTKASSVLVTLFNKPISIKETHT